MNEKGTEPESSFFIPISIHHSLNRRVINYMQKTDQHFPFFWFKDNIKYLRSKKTELILYHKVI